MSETAQEWVRAAEAARMMNVSRERVRQLIVSGTLESKREPGRVCLVRVASIHARLGTVEQPQSST